MADLENYRQELIAAALPYWEAEGEIARRFFAAGPSREQHLLWLRAQIWKELNPVDGYFNGLHRELQRLADRFPEIDTTYHRHDFSGHLRQLLEEFEHYVLFADILEYVTGRPLQLDDKVQLPEEKRLQALRASYMATGSHQDRVAVLFTEGGGARLFREGARVEGGELERRIAAAMQVIYDDEKDHLDDAVAGALAAIGGRDDADRVVAAIVAISRQRVAMRQEMFGYPLSEDELAEFIANVDPATA